MSKRVNQDQIDLAAEIDVEVTALLKQDGDEALLQGMLPIMHKLKPMLDSAEPGQMDDLCERFPAFHHLIQLLEAMSLAIAGGKLDDILER